MRFKTLPTLAIALTVAAVPAAAQAQDHPEGPPPADTATFIGKIKRDGADKATLKVRYTCDTGQTLWVSAKQSKHRKKKDAALTKEGSSQVAAAWLQSHANPVTCDGAKHTATFTIDKSEQGKGKLKKGKAYVQFCLTAGESLTLSKSGWMGVK